ncbi:MAG: DUF1697 domain-containing protein [Pseudonocardiaceae bacterium]
MRTHIALLRGINLGGRNRVAMTDLRAVVTSLAHTDVATYIQSGNAANWPHNLLAPPARWPPPGAQRCVTGPQ